MRGVENPDPPAPARLVVAGLVVSRNGSPLAGPLDFALRAGEALAVRGPNGAGKSTLLRTLLGLVPAAAGTVGVANMAAPDGEPARRLHEAAHYLGHRDAMKPADTLAANLRFWQRFLGRPRLDEGEALAAVGLDGAGAVPFAYLSAGQKRRAALARLLVSHRPVWLLDEPTTALDAEGRQLFAGLCAAHLAASGIVVAATHQRLGFPAGDLRLVPPATASAGPERDLADAWT